MKTIFEDLEYLEKSIEDKKARKIVKELEKNIICSRPKADSPS
jgi:hypothetical protein